MVRQLFKSLDFFMESYFSEALDMLKPPTMVTNKLLTGIIQAGTRGGTVPVLGGPGCVAWSFSIAAVFYLALGLVTFLVHGDLTAMALGDLMLNHSELGIEICWSKVIY